MANRPPNLQMPSEPQEVAHVSSPSTAAEIKMFVSRLRLEVTGERPPIAGKAPKGARRP